MTSILLVLCLTSLLISSYTFAGDCDIRGPYWRYFQGELPSDALSAGITKDGFQAYVGNTIDNINIVPGHFNAKTKSLHYTLDGTERVQTNNVMILCSQHPEQFQFMKASAKTIDSFDKSTLVNGGYQPNHLTFIGRAVIDGMAYPGKVMVNTTGSERRLFFSKDGKGEIFEDYEVLAYNKNLPMTSCFSKEDYKVLVSKDSAASSSCVCKETPNYCSQTITITL